VLRERIEVVDGLDKVVKVQRRIALNEQMSQAELTYQIHKYKSK